MPDRQVGTAPFSLQRRSNRILRSPPRCRCGFVTDSGSSEVSSKICAWLPSRVTAHHPCRAARTAASRGGPSGQHACAFPPCPAGNARLRRVADGGQTSWAGCGPACRMAGRGSRASAASPGAALRSGKLLGSADSHPSVRPRVVRAVPTPPPPHRGCWSRADSPESARRACRKPRGSRSRGSGGNPRAAAPPACQRPQSSAAAPSAWSRSAA